MTLLEHRLLIVEDDAAFAEVVSDLASSLGFACVTADQPDEIAKYLCNWRPSLITVDLQMPHISVISVVKLIAEHSPHARIVIVSGMDDRVREATVRIAVSNDLCIVGSLQKPSVLKALSRIFVQEHHEKGWLTAQGIAKAIGTGQIAPLVQPKVCIHSGKLVGGELLARWNHPALGIIMPDKFMSLVEASALESDLFLSIADLGLSGCADLIKRTEGFALSINLSPRGAMTESVPEELASLCTRHGVPPGNVVVELTESGIYEGGVALEVLVRLRIAGFGLSLDDFGTGFSSLSHLRELPLTELKIDKSFVMDSERSKDAAVICRTIIGMAKNLGLTCIAEGVESRDVARNLAHWGCDIAQGYFYAKPTGLDQLDHLRFEEVP